LSGKLGTPLLYSLCFDIRSPTTYVAISYYVGGGGGGAAATISHVASQLLRSTDQSTSAAAAAAITSSVRITSSGGEQRTVLATGNRRRDGEYVPRHRASGKYTFFTKILLFSPQILHENLNRKRVPRRMRET